MDHPTAPIPPHAPRGEGGPTPTTSYAEALTAPPPPRLHRHRGRRVGELAAVGILSAALATGGTWGVISLTDQGPGETPPVATGSSVGGDGVASVVPVSSASKTNPDWNAVTAAVSPSVVAITVKSGSSGGEGSGVIIDGSGHVLTNHHVVSGAGDDAQITVTLADGSTYAATVAGEDASTDLAVVTITDPPQGLRPITMGSSQGLTVGDPVMAVGNPLGLAGTVTTGIVSALNRPVTTSASESGGQDPFAQQQASPVVTSAIQTSAAVNPGNSGGALVDAAGRLVGINSSIATLGGSGGQSGSIGIGFAIPVDEAQWIAEQLIEDGSAEHALLGVTPVDGSAKVGSATRSGAQVRSVSDGSAADKAGLREGDLIVGVDDTGINSAESLVGMIHAQRIGSTVSLSVIRDGQEQTIKATLGTAPSAQG
ncbi:S1C family serine protease [Janibacter limosus]|jgi:putative serine protease PepD|uniref:S1C family serine protease n=1 Tax=Janibacter limosus TaxID=53458 RepID=UPI000A974D58|nr:trypsin-like peptidase domain-containing protein [Janibacter limosus]